MLFETESVYTYDEYRKSVYGVWKESKRYVIFIMLAIFLIFAGIVNIIRDGSNLGWILILIAIVEPVLIFCLTESRIKKAYYSNKALKDLAVHFKFYDDYFEVESKTGKSHIEYENLYKLYEKKDNFYPMTGSNMVYIIEKSRCSDGLISFLHDKALAVN